LSYDTAQCSSFEHESKDIAPMLGWLIGNTPRPDPRQLTGWQAGRLIGTDSAQFLSGTEWYPNSSLHT
jgi:hypothetical protein